MQRANQRGFGFTICGRVARFEMARAAVWYCRRPTEKDRGKTISGNLLRRKERERDSTRETSLTFRSEINGK